MLILRSIAFSFAILWRLVLVFPFLILGLIVLGIIIVIPAAILILIFPPVGIFVTAGASYAMSSIVPLMVGARMGLQARGITPRNGYGGILLPALGYGLVETVMAIILMVIGAAAFVLIGNVSIEEILAMFRFDPDMAVENLIATSPVLAWSIILVTGLGLTFVRAALLVPLAGASVGRDPDSSPHTPFWGTGTAFFSMLVLVVLSYVAYATIGPLLTVGSVGVVAQTGWLDAADTSGGSIWALVLLIAGLVVGWLWSISLQCAGGVLAYLRFNADAEIFAAEDTAAQEMDREELRNLWKSRMPPGRK